MTTPFQILFGVRSLNGRVEAFANDATRTRVFTDKFRKGRPLMARYGTFEWDELQFSRALAPVVGRDAPFPIRQHLVKINRRSSVAHIKESKVISAAKLYDERAPGELLPNAELTLDTEIRDMVNRISNTVEYLCAHAVDGTQTVNSTNIPGTEAPFTIAYSPNTYTASASWATAGTAILSSEIPAAKQDFEQVSGLSPAQVIIGNTIEGYLIGNTEVSNFLQYTLGERVLTQAGMLHGPMLGGLRIGGLDWIITEGGYVPDGGSFTRYVAATDDAYMLPSDGDLRDVLGFAEGRGFIPVQELGPAQASADLARPAPSEGFYSYATVEKNPAGVRVYVGWVGLPVLLYPNGVNVLDVVP